MEGEIGSDWQAAAKFSIRPAQQDYEHPDIKRKMFRQCPILISYS